MVLATTVNENVERKFHERKMLLLDLHLMCLDRCLEHARVLAGSTSYTGGD